MSSWGPDQMRFEFRWWNLCLFFFFFFFPLVQTEVGKGELCCFSHYWERHFTRAPVWNSCSILIVLKFWLGDVISPVVKTFTCLIGFIFINKMTLLLLSNMSLKQQWSAERNIEQNRKLGISSHILLHLLRHRAQVSLICSVCCFSNGRGAFCLSKVMESVSFCKVVEGPKKDTRCIYCCLVFLWRYATILSLVLPNEERKKFECYSTVIDDQQLIIASLK